MRAASAIPELSGVLRRARTPDDLDALAARAQRPGHRPRRHRRDVHRALDGGDVGGARRDRGLHRVPPPGPRRLHARGAARCRWPRSTWPRRPPRRRPGSGRRRRLIAVRDRLAPYLRPEAKVKPKDVPALVEALWRVQTAVQAIAARADVDPGPVGAGRAGTRSSTPTCSTAQVQWLRRAGAAVDGSSPFHVALRKLIVAGLPAGSAPRDAVARLRDAVVATCWPSAGAAPTSWRRGPGTTASCCAGR